MGHDLEPRPATPSEIIAGLKGEIEARRVSGAEIHIHYHAGGSTAPAPTCTHDHAPNPADKAIPYFVILLGGCIVLAIIGVVVILLVPAIMALATTIMVFMIGFAVVMIALAASVRSLRTSRADVHAARLRR